MELYEFEERVKEEVGRLCGEKYQIEILDMVKNNGVTRRGLNISKNGGGTGTVIYPDAYYEKFESGEMTIKDVAEKLYDTFTAAKIPDETGLLSGGFEALKYRVIFRLVNQERNEGLLKTVPWVPFHDLAVVFLVLLEDGKDGCTSFLIHDSHARSWGIDAGELYGLARRNTPFLFPYEFSSVADILRRLCGLGEGAGSLEEASRPLYVLTNKRKVNGAAVMLYDNVLKNISRVLGTDLVIFPSSVHEVLITPYRRDLDVREMEGMVRMINQTEVPEEDVLSDSVYLYRRGAEDISIACEPLEPLGETA